MKKTILTQAALDKVIKERDNLIIKRKLISEEIKKARGFGDLSENAEYHAAREEQSLNETEISKLTDIIENHELVKKPTDSETVSINSVLKILYLDTNEESEIQIVTKIESDPFEGKISNESPIGNGLIGHKENETITVETPNGEIEIKILKILE